MRIFAIGDIQGCYESLRRLLDSIQFDPEADQLWSVGDLVNRGPASLRVLQFCRQLGDSFRTVLGNHDLHLLAIARGDATPRRNDTLDDILESPDRESLLDWLQRQPLFMHDAGRQVALVHAGVPPQWTLQDTRAHAAEVESVLQSDRATDFFCEMYGNQPDIWDNQLEGPPRWRLITNYLTRMRFCSADGRLDLTHKEGPETAPPGYFPWYSLESPVLSEVRLIFGHWASLQGVIDRPKLQALDTGCVWGGSLTVAEITAGFRRHSVPAAESKP